MCTRISVSRSPEGLALASGGDLRESSYSRLQSAYGRILNDLSLSISEIQVLLVELIRNFEFSLTPKCDRIRRENSLVMAPTIEGELEKGVQCPLRIRCVAKYGQD